MKNSPSIPTTDENPISLHLVKVEDLQDLNQAKAQVEKSQARFREIIESISDIYFIHDVAGYFTYLAPQITSFLSYPVESLLGHSLDEITHPDDLAPIEAMIATLLETRIPHDNIEMRVRHADGNWVWMSVSHSVIVDETDTIIGIQGFARNINDRRVAEENLQARTKHLEQTLKELQRTQMQMIQSEKMSSLGQLVAGIAHEINNPVNFIYGNLSYSDQYSQDLIRIITAYQAELPTPSAALQEMIDNIDLDYLIIDLPKLVNSMKVGAERIREIVLSLRNFSRLDEAEFKLADIHLGINSTLMILQNRLKVKDRRPEIITNLGYGDIPNIKCYAGQLNQVFMNIIVNSIDALEESFINGHVLNPEITIQTLKQDDRIIISIMDNGLGIEPEQLSRLFDPFYTTKPVGQGTGMGLSISYQIVVDRHGGTLNCISAIGSGTKFIITLPIKHSKNQPRI
jgi:two-component system NtrC family sensor kinase